MDSLKFISWYETFLGEEGRKIYAETVLDKREMRTVHMFQISGSEITVEDSILQKDDKIEVIRHVRANGKADTGIEKNGIAFGMEILAYDPYMPAEKIEADGAKAVDLDTMLRECDMLSIHLPVLESTKGMVNKEWFSKMKPTAYVINTARAAVIDQKDFIEALRNKAIAGAAVDVYWEEPVPANHPLLSMRNVVCTPHMAGLTTDVDNWSGEMMAQEVLAYVKGEERKYIWNR